MRPSKCASWAIRWCNRCEIPADPGPREFAAYVASEPIKVASDVLDISQPAMLARIASFIQGIEIEFGRGASKSRKSKAPSKTIGVSVYTWRKK